MEFFRHLNLGLHSILLPFYRSIHFELSYLLGILIFFFFCSVQLSAQSEVVGIDSITRYVYHVKATNCSDNSGDRHSSGFKVKGKPGVYTSLHSIVGCKLFFVTNRVNGFDKTQVYDRISEVDLSHDVAYLIKDSETASDTSDGLEVSKVKGAQELANKKLTVIGYPRGVYDYKENTVDVLSKATRVLIDLVADEYDEALEKRGSPAPFINVLDLQGTLKKGQSGAPIFYEWNIVGIANGGLGQGDSWAIPWNEIRLKPIKELSSGELEIYTNLKNSKSHILTAYENGKFGTLPFEPFSIDEKLKVLILPFSILEQRSDHFVDIENTIKSRFENWKAENIGIEERLVDIEIKVIEDLDFAPSNYIEALELGNKLNADLVLFGDYYLQSIDEDAIEIKYVLVTDMIDHYHNPKIGTSGLRSLPNMTSIRTGSLFNDIDIITYYLITYSLINDLKYDQAIRVLDQIKIEPTKKFLDLYSLYARSYEFKKDLDKAKSYLDTIFQIDDQSAFAYEASASINFYEGQFDKALANLEAAFLLDSTNFTTLSKLAAIHASLGNYEESSAFFDRVFSREDAYSEYNLLNYAVLKYRMSGPQEAVIHTKAAYESYPEDLNIGTSHAHMLMEAGRLEESEHVINTFLKKNRQNADLLAFKGQLRLKYEDLDSAQFYTTKAHLLDSSNYNALITNALLAAKQKKSELSLKLLEDVKVSASKLDQVPFGLNWGIASIYSEFEQYDSALHYYKLYYDEYSSDAIVILNYSQTLNKLGRFDEQKAVLERAVKQLPNDELVLTFHLKFLNGNYLNEKYSDHTVKSDSLEYYAENLLGINPNNSFALAIKGRSLHQKGEKDRGLENMKRAVDLSNDSPVTELLVGVYLYRAKEFGLAKEYLDRAMIFVGNEVDEINYFVVKIYLELCIIFKDFDNGSKYGRNVLLKYPTHDWALYFTALSELALNKIEGAGSILKQINESSGYYSWAQYSLAIVHRAKGDLIFAAMYYSNYLNLPEATEFATDSEISLIDIMVQLDREFSDSLKVISSMDQRIDVIKKSIKVEEYYRPLSGIYESRSSNLCDMLLELALLQAKTLQFIESRKSLSKVNCIDIQDQMSFTALKVYLLFELESYSEASRQFKELKIQPSGFLQEFKKLIKNLPKTRKHLKLIKKLEN